MHRIMQCLRNLDKQTIVFVIQLIQYFVRRKYSDGTARVRPGL